MYRLLYVSESRIEEADAQSVVSRIVEHAQINNALSGLTGALIFTGQHFAQVLEGPREAIHTVMACIQTDKRHSNVVVVDETPITGRLLADWQMAYCGPSQFVSRHVTRLLHATSQSERQRATDWLTELARQFTAKPF
ncbi:BLUF domain-containing protein [Sphingorhabdus sp.]|uniref:BLUF domain-containing protein n=1 Tax=Sphingorhabdus sp. TaxID=1902408 RepID=UPI003982EBA7